MAQTVHLRQHVAHRIVGERIRALESIAVGVDFARLAIQRVIGEAGRIA